MTKAISGGFQSHIDGETTELGTCLYFRRRDGTEFLFTDHDKDIVLTGTVTDPRGRVMDGTYATIQAETPSDIEGSKNMSVDNLDIVTILSDTGITEADMLSGKWDYADFNIFHVVPSDVSLGVVWLMSGKLGEVSISKGSDTGTVELRSKSALLQETIGDLVTHECNADLGDARCAVIGNVSEWAASTAYTAGDRVRSTLKERVHFVCSTGGTSGSLEPLWNVTLAGTTADGSVVWDTVNLLQAQAWAATTAYVVDDVVRPSAFDTRRYVCTTAGTSDSVEPTWDTALDAETTDATVTWTTGFAFLWEGTVTSLVDAANFKDSALTDADATFVDDWFEYGLLVWLTGNNAGVECEVKSSVKSDGQITVWEELIGTIQIGDTFLIEAGCNKAYATCKAKFDNVINMRGFPWVPGRDVLMNSPIAKGVAKPPEPNPVIESGVEPTGYNPDDDWDAR